MKYICELCGTVYDEAKATAFAQLPQDFSCPTCGSEKEAFTPVDRMRVNTCTANLTGGYVKYPDEHHPSER